MPVEKTSLVDSVSLAGWVADVLSATSMETEHASLSARMLVRANLRGIDTHGVMRLPGYVRGLMTGSIKPRPQITQREVGALLHIDGDNGLGQAVSMIALRTALDRCELHPIQVCSITRSGHLGAIGVIALEAASQGILAVVCQATPRFMAVPGSTGASIGNNPIAFAAPLSCGKVLTFDAAMSLITRGRVMEALASKTELPPGVAHGPGGLPTVDPRSALEGFLLPVGAHKGIGLAMLVQLLAGSVGNTLLGSSAGDDQSHGFYLLINVAALAPDGAASFASDARGWLDTFLSISPGDARLPGSRADDEEERRTEEGIPVPLRTITELERIGSQVGVLFPG